MVMLLPNTSQNAIRFLFLKASWLTFNHDFQVLFCRAALQLGSSQPVLVRVVPPQVQDFALSLVEHCEILVSPFLQPVKLPLDCNRIFGHISRSSQFGVIHKLAEGTHCSIIYISKVLNRTGLSIDPWDKPLGTGLQLGFVPLISPLWAQSFSQFSVYFKGCSSSLYFMYFIIYEDVMGDNGKTLTGDKIDNIHCSPLMQSFHCRRSLHWLSMTPPW